MPTVCATEGKIPVEARVGVNTGEVVVRSIQVRRPYRIHAGRSCDQSGGADADGGAGGFDRGQ